MSTENTTYELRCETCGNLGGAVVTTDDYFRWSGSIHGFSGPVRVTGPQVGFLACDKCGGQEVVQVLPELPTPIPEAVHRKSRKPDWSRVESIRQQVLSRIK
jgi:hypothetical protein